MNEIYVIRSLMSSVILTNVLKNLRDIGPRDDAQSRMDSGRFWANIGAMGNADSGEECGAFRSGPALERGVLISESRPIAFGQVPQRFLTVWISADASSEARQVIL